MKALITLILLSALATGCATIEPNTIPVEFTHVSHATQHFEAHPTDFGFNALSVGAKWNITRGLSVKLEEGVVLDSRVYYQTRDNGRQAMYGGLMGPREVFTGTIAYEFRLK